MMNKLTVLMPSYNRGAYINEAVTSVLNQKTDFGVKLIITDDCSTDGSIEIIKELQRQYPERIEIILSEKNERLLANILKAQVRVQTEYFCVLDPDDYYTDELFLQKAVDYLEEHKDFTIYGSNCMMLYEDKKEKPFIENNVKENVFDFNDLLQDKVIITQTAGSIFRNIVYNNGIPEIIKNAIGTYSESSFRADTERYIFHLEKGKAFFQNEIVAVYRIHKDGIWTKENQFHRNLLAAQAYYDYFRYFNYTHADYFIHYSLFYTKECFEELKKAIDKNEFTQTIVQSDIEQLFAIIVEDEKYFDKIAEDNDKLYIKKSLTVRKLIKYLLPYGFVRLIQKIRRQ
ncbi:glycosyltransferase family 2 protein [Treponema denticola]|uniref:Glycosyltransferase family 2 protein n=1 Tax=Treponema denticola TaxID=158 RepID=A0A9Q9BH56_TREDN|nr:glycosyltransferase family 2 protein [Treponema denticola]UTC90774.1 glycosyltransferase family 2 protein [Treponema denticola]UTC99874.1 glycosyltransferase family 2 protein [Treponema denticola]